MNSTPPSNAPRRRWAGRDRLKGRRDSGWFLRMPVAVLESENYKALSFKARALILDLGAQYRGNNNGDLAAAWSIMSKRGWKSKDTLQRARNELLSSGMIEQTRWGGLHCCSLYAFTWLQIDECGGKLDVAATKTASALWRNVNRAKVEEKTRCPPHSSGDTAPNTVATYDPIDTMDGAHCPDSRD